MRARPLAVTLSLVAIAAAAASPSTATFSGADGRISFTRVVGNELRIFSAAADGSDVTRLTGADGGITFVSDWSPDGERIAFDSEGADIEGRKRSVQIYIMNADGSARAQLTRGPGFHGNPGWAPDGTKLAIDADWGKRSLEGIWIIPLIDPDGVRIEDAQQITDTPENADFDTEPQFSPDGTKLVFTRFRSPRKSAIHTVGTDGSGIDRLTKWKLNASDPDWSPDGARITFDSGDAGRPRSKGDIYVINADGSALERIVSRPRLKPDGPFDIANNPVWAPSGTKYTQFFNERNELRSINPDGSGQATVLKLGGFPNKVDWGVHP